MDTGCQKFTSDENILPDNQNYREAVGAFLYISTITKPDIMAATSIFRQMNENSRQADWNVEKEYQLFK